MLYKQFSLINVDGGKKKIDSRLVIVRSPKICFYSPACLQWNKSRLSLFSVLENLFKKKKKKLIVHMDLSFLLNGPKVSRLFFHLTIGGFIWDFDSGFWWMTDGWMDGWTAACWLFSFFHSSLLIIVSTGLQWRLKSYCLLFQLVPQDGNTVDLCSSPFFSSVLPLCHLAAKKQSVNITSVKYPSYIITT